MFSPTLAALNAALYKVGKQAGVHYNCAWGVYFWVHKDIFIRFCERHFSFIANVLNFSLCQLPAISPRSLLCSLTHFLIHISLSNGQKLPTSSDISCFTPVSAFPCQKGYTASRILALCNWLSAIGSLLQQSKKEVSTFPDAENLNIFFLFGLPN